MALILWIFELGYVFQHIGAILQILKIKKNRSMEGVSVDTQILFLIGSFARAIWIHDTMLKNFFLSYIEFILAVGILVYTLYLCMFQYNPGFPLSHFFNNPKLPIFIRWYVLLIASAILSLIFYPGKEDRIEWDDPQIFVSLNIFTEAIGLLPQIWAVKIDRDSTNFSRSYILFLAVARMCRLLFWLKMHMDDNSFMFLIIADVIHLISVSGFIYTFFKNLNTFNLPTNDDRHHNAEKKIF
jgi:ER lumen protein retaining receptor